MEKSLIIVESPSKAKTINKYLGKEYVVEASVGHIKNLPKSKLSVDIDKDFDVVYEPIKGKEEVLKRLRDRAAKSKQVFIATDPDREGEAIAAHIAEELKDVNRKIKRVLFHEITDNGVREGMERPKEIDTDLVMAQQARRAMDRIVGYKVSPFVWKTVYYGLSAGRVQSVALRIICEREKAIQSFVPAEYWSITGEFQTPAGDSFLAKLAKISGEDPNITDETAARGFVSDIEKKK
jgi:DNA topoisomerase-1